MPALRGKQQKKQEIVCQLLLGHAFILKTQQQGLSLQVCLVGKSRNYELPDEAEAERRRANYVESRKTRAGVTVQGSDVRNEGACRHGDKDTDRTRGSSWGAGFQPRDRVETVRNCAALPRDFVDGVVLQVANVLLGMTEGDGGGAAGEWNRGGKTFSCS